jgi:hypothetical protein
MGDDLLLDDASTIEEMLNMISYNRWYLYLWYLKNIPKKLI